MEQNNFFLNLIAKLNKVLSKQQINTDIKGLGKFYIELIGRLPKRKTQQQLKNDLSNTEVKVNLTPQISKTNLRKALKDVSGESVKVDVNIGGGKQIKDAASKVNKLGQEAYNTDTAFSRMKNTLSKTFSSGKLAMTGYLMVLNEIHKAGQNAKQTIQEIDKAVTDLAIATNMSRESISGLVKNYNEYAKLLASTTTQITSAADDYLRAGKTMDEAQALIKYSIMLSKLGQIDSKAATEDLLAVMNGYGMSIGEVSKALDSLVAIDMAAATSSGDIATALKYSAASADLAGVSFNKLAAMIGTVQDKTQQSSETVGTFMNTLLSRYRNVKIGQFLDDDGEDLSEVESILNSLNIKLRDGRQEFRNFETVIDEVAKKWDSYSSVQQAAIAKAFSGTRQQNRFIALMQGYNKTLELTEIAANSAGTAVEKFNNAYMNSLESKQNTLQASFESMVMNADLDEVYSGILDATNALVDFINHANALKGIFAGLTVNWGIKAFLALKSGIGEAYITLNRFQNALDMVKRTKISTKEYERLLLLSNGLSTSQMRLILTMSNLTVAQKKELLVASGLSEQEAILQLQTWKMTAANTGLTAATVSLGNAFRGLWATLIANPLIVVTALVSGIVMAYQSYQQRIEEVREKNKEAADSAIDAADKMRELYSEYSKLSSIQERTSNEEDSYKKIVEDITSLLGERAEALRGLSQGTEEYTAKLKELTQAELNEQYTQAVVGRKSAEEDLKDDIWGNWNGSKVSVYSNSKGKKLSDDAKQAANIVSDALKDYETVNRTWGNAAWGISSDNPEEAVNYYIALKKAREDLVNASRDNEALLDTEIYSNLNAAINTMSDSVEEYLDKKYEEQKLYYLANNGIPTTVEEYRKLEKAVLNAAGANEGMKASFKDLLAEDFSALSSQLDAVEAIEAINEKAEQSSLFSALSSAMESLSKIQSLYSDFRQNLTDGDDSTDFHLPIEDIESLKDALKDTNDNLLVSEEEFKKFEMVLADQSSTANQMEDAFNALITSYVDSALKLGNYTDETKELIKTQLELKGITADSADAYVEYQTAMAKAKEAVADVDLAEMTSKEVDELISEGKYAGLVADQIWALYDAKLAENALSIDSSEDCKQLLNLANTAYFTAEALRLVKELDEVYNNSWGSGYAAAAIKEQLAALANGGGLTLKPEPKLILDPAKAKKSDKDTTKEFDWIEQAVENAEKEIKKLDDIVNSSYSTFMQKNDALAGEVGKVTEEIALQQKAYEEYMRKANSVGLDESYKSLVRDGAINIENVSDEKLQQKISDYQQWYEKAVSASDSMLELGEKIKDLHVKGYELNAERIEELLNSESITEKQYISEMKRLYQEYYENQVDYAEQAHRAKLSLLEREKSYLNSVANAAASLFDREIENIRNGAQAQVDAYEAQIDLLNKRKKPLQDELDMLEQKARDENLILDLQQKQFDLERAKNQNSVLLYTEGKGFNYVVNNKDVREKQKAVDDAELEIKKNDIQKQIDILDAEIDRYNELIDAVNKSADQQIRALESMKNQWLEVIEQQEEAKNAILLTGEFGIDAIAKILSGDEKLLNQWKSSYIAAIAGIDMENAGYIGNMTERLAELYGADLTPLVEQFGGVKDSVNEVNKAVMEASSAISSGGDEDEGSGKSTEKRDSMSLKDSILDETETALSAFGQHTDALNNEVIPAIQSATAEMNAFNQAADTDIHKTITIEYVVKGGGGLIGKAFAGGSPKGLPRDEKNALRSEYGQQELTVYPDGTTELTTSPVMGDLPKGTVIYDEEQTKKILKNKSAMKGKAYAGGTVSEGWIGADGHRYVPIRPGDMAWEMKKAFEPLLQKMIDNPNYFAVNAMIEHGKQMEKVVNQLNTASVVTNNKQQQSIVNNNEFNITLPNVTNSTSAENLMRDLQSLATKKFQINW